MSKEKGKKLGKKKISAKAKILEFFLANMGRPVHWKELQKLTGITEWGRRVRELRNEMGYQILSDKDRSDLSPGYYFMETDKRLPAFERNISKQLRAMVLERNGNTCRMCGAGAGDADPYNPNRKVRLHIGHVLDKSKGGADTLENLRAVCSNCNEGLQNIAMPKPDFVSLIANIRKCPEDIQLQVLQWLQKKFQSK